MDGPVSRDSVREDDYPFDRIPFDHDHCFLCGRVVDTDGRTREHVFPRWLLHKFNLWNEQLTLLNGSGIPYRQLTVPCCLECNTGPLSRLEDEVQSAVEIGYGAADHLPEIRLFQWAAKIMFGVLFKEISLEHDRRARTGNTILDPKSLDDFTMLHDLLQSVRVTTKFEGGPFFSVHVVPLHVLEGMEFDFADSIADEVVAMRLGEVGLIVSLMDAGMSKPFTRPILAALHGRPLHPIQFDELMAHVVSVKQRMTRIPKFILISGKGGESSTIVRMPLGGMSLKPLLYDFEVDHFRPILGHYLARWGEDVASVWNREVGVGTTLFAEPGRIALCDTNFDLLESIEYEAPNPAV
jgi:hypothetical protein